MTARYVLCPGLVHSRIGGEPRYISARELSRLYGVPFHECLIADYGPGPGCNYAEMMERVKSGELIALHPRHDGNYSLPSTHRPHGCHNRAPFLPETAMQDGWLPAEHNGEPSRMPRMEAVPFRMASDCRYTLSDLGQNDPRCAGCRWRVEPST